MGLYLGRLGPLYGIKKLIIPKIIRKQRMSQDTVILVTGPEGSGKSTLWTFLVDMIKAENGLDFVVSKQCAFRLERFLVNWGLSPREVTLVLDEGKELMGNNWQSKDLKLFENKMTSLRISSHIYIICITNPFRVMRYLREDKISYIFHCMARKRVKVFRAKTFFKMLEKIKDFHGTDLLDKSKEEMFVDKLQIASGPLWEEYMTFKHKFEDDEKRMLAERDRMEYAPAVAEVAIAQREVQPDPIEKLYSVREAAKMLGIGRNIIYDVIKAGKLKTVTSLTGVKKVQESVIRSWVNGNGVNFTQTHASEPKKSSQGEVVTT